jgi:hypothetical protein
MGFESLGEADFCVWKSLKAAGFAITLMNVKVFKRDGGFGTEGGLDA